VPQPCAVARGAGDRSRVCGRLKLVVPLPARDKTGQKGDAPEPGVRARRAMSRRDQRLRLLIPGPSAAQTAGAVPAVSGWVPQNRHRLDADHRPCEGPPAAERGVASSFGSARPI
jgi:hypothetical protein